MRAHHPGEEQLSTDESETDPGPADEGGDPACWAHLGFGDAAADRCGDLDEDPGRRRAVEAALRAAVDQQLGHP